MKIKVKKESKPIYSAWTFPITFMTCNFVNILALYGFRLLVKLKTSL